MVTKSLGVTVELSTPITSSGQQYAATYTGEVSAYSHKVSAWLGFDSASISLVIPRHESERLISNILMYNVVVYGPDSSEIFRGFVNECTVNYGAVSVVRGPVTAITNLCYALYSPVDTSVTPPFVGSRTVSAGATSQESIDRFGTFERVLQAGEATTTGAEQLRDTYIRNNAWPETGKSISIGSSGNVSLDITVLGYAHLLGAYLYYTASGGVVTAQEKIVDILSDDPNGIFSTIDDNIIANGLLVPDYEIDYPTAMDAIKGVVEFGDANDNRWTFGVYENNVVYYAPIPTTIQYVYRTSETANYIYSSENDTIINGWNVRPARWMAITDILTGDASGLYDVSDDPRNAFIESVTWTAPNSISIEHSKNNSLERKLAKLSMGRY